MAKLVPDAANDASLAWQADSDTLCVCSQQPTTEAEAYTTYMLARVAVTPGAGNGDFTIGNGDTSGRKLTVAAQAGVSITNAGTATHVVLVKHTDNTIRNITTCTNQALVAGGTVDVPQYDADEIADAA